MKSFTRVCIKTRRCRLYKTGTVNMVWTRPKNFKTLNSKENTKLEPTRKQMARRTTQKLERGCGQRNSRKWSGRRPMDE